MKITPRSLKPRRLINQKNRRMLMLQSARKEKVKMPMMLDLLFLRMMTPI